MQAVDRERGELFTMRTLAMLIVPLFVDQFLMVFMGMADTVMVSGIGEAAVSAVSLVDNINLLINQVFAALAAGGSVVAAQYFGRGDRANACASAKQLYQVTLAAGLIVGAVVAILNVQVLNAVFGTIHADVYSSARSYLLASAISYPFLGIYSAGAAMYRSMGNSKVTMVVSLMMNVIKLAFNALMIYVLNMGVLGAALSTLLARMLAAVLYTIWIRQPSNKIFIHDIHKPEWRPELIKKILHIGVPTGVENGLFQVGKLLTLNLIAGLGLASIAANAIVSSVSGMFQLPGNAISLALVTVVGQCMGAERPDEAERLTKRLIMLSIGALIIFQVAQFLLARPLIAMYNLSPEATEIALNLIRVLAPFIVLFWSLSFALPNALRAAGDVKFTMTVSMTTMWLCRVALSYLLIRQFGFGVDGVWYSMYADWVVRAIVFSIRFFRGRWKLIHVI